MDRLFSADQLASSVPLGLFHEIQGLGALRRVDRR
jgi:hypothetical protein